MQKNLVEFGTKLSQKLIIKENEKRLLVLNTLNTTDIVLEKNSSLTLAAILTQGWEEKQLLNFYLDGEKSELNFIVFMIGKKENSFPFETVSHHNAPQTKAFFNVYGAMFDQSETDYTGNLIINPEAQMTIAHLAHHSLMLSEKAKVISIPSLEILANDVKAGHSATMGKIDPESMFYIKSRGLDHDQAEELLTEAFLLANLNKIPEEGARIVIKDIIETALC